MKSKKCIPPLFPLKCVHVNVGENVGGRYSYRCIYIQIMID